MLGLFGGKSKFCDGVSRRNFLNLGTFGPGLTLADTLRARASKGAGASARSTQKAAIMIYLPGGPSHMDMYDLKPDAPAEVRGDFKPSNLKFNNHDYSRVRGHVTASAGIPATVTSAMPASTTAVTASEGCDAGGGCDGGGSEKGGGSGGGGGSSGEDGGDGDGEPPTTAGLTPDGDGQKPRPVWTLLKLLWGLVPSIRNVWHCLKFTFPHSICQQVIRDELRSLERARRIARGKGLAFRAFVWAALRWRTALLVLRCVRESLKEAGIDVQLVLRL